MANKVETLIVSTPSEMGNPEAARRELKKGIKEALAKSDTITMGFVHYMYGPLRGLKFKIKKPNPEFLEEWIVKDSISLGAKVWEKSRLAARAMILPDDLKFDTEPQEFETLKKAEEFIMNMLEVTPTFQEDPYFFRLGKV